MATQTSTTKDFLTVINERQSVRKYDPSFPISKEELKEILELTGKAPSAWNLQQWHFLVFHGEEAQKRLLPIAYNQQQIVDASAVIAVLGDLEANRNTDSVYDPLVEAGHMTKEIKETLAKQIAGAYENKQYARDAAFTNASLAAMQLMLVATAKGWSTCPIGGFDAEKFMKEFQVPERYIPVMLVTIGKSTAPAHRSTRLPVDVTTTWIEK
ncbi:nitroreductase family protein [Anoxybacillus rupiensis]|jgi:nitroreductase|uniref:Nitroreductase family protein n=1 Tax=Anoxybacteroides rupiense TaxID=311460 RepID=A0ABD5IPT5_9BACL|nr:MULTISPECIES: nitroreductase family protein [Anoxybacillus]KXG10344.1 putative NAD(P)H nitroreductase YodC [Anoxybacillus sp. P3H1B]MBB3906372.1 nitroreductase [Anoxybacillus rupiensis]MBS2770644.1 nitroreductase family protein [Anoxybacillus rupiensis]MDE8564361.1 nitroreductase family protein [Anoxybacillus rupiensis]MED5050285.1 nitroreductase family protein [Anoxybacillus rupiensis]